MSKLKAIAAIKEDLVEFTRKIVRIPSLTGEEEKVAKTVLAKLRSFGIDEAWIDEIGNVIGVLRGKGCGPNVLLNGHLDVVPAGRLENWRFDPFGAEIDEKGNIRGRGTADMKGGLSALVFVMKLMKDLKDQGVELSGDIIFSAVVFEEAAEMFGMEYLCKTSLPDKELSFDVCYLAEPTTGHVNIGQRGKVELVVKTLGKTVHSSQPWNGINALEKMVPILIHVFNKAGLGLRNHHDLGQSSISVTNLVCKPGTMSIVPDECEISVDRRYVPGETPEGIVNEFNSLLKEIKNGDPQFESSVQVRTLLEKSYTGYAKVVQKHHPVWLIERDHLFVQKTLQALKRIGQQGDIGFFVGGVDGGMTTGLMGIPTIGYSGADENLAHTAEEYIPIETLVEDTEAYVSILCELFNIDISFAFED